MLEWITAQFLATEQRPRGEGDQEIEKRLV
jgi:hypothetical protein